MLELTTSSSSQQKHSGSMHRVYSFWQLLQGIDRCVCDCAPWLSCR
jgi:hypothetical protein